MKVIAALDSFKGSISSVEAGYAVKEGIQKADKSIEVIVRPLADGGEGTARALTEGLGGRFATASVRGPMGGAVQASYGILQDQTAVIEMAEAAGITLVKKEDLDPWKASTYGVGEMILDAVSHGCRRFLVGIGGSAANDGGIGMLTALGFVFLDSRGDPVKGGALGLSDIARIDGSKVPSVLKECFFEVACDVQNPLCGQNGATYIYGPQKGVTERMREPLDAAMRHYACQTEAYMGENFSGHPGAGAAGGMGFAFLSYLPCVLRSGAELVLKATSLEEDIRGADYLVTGEGRLDSQTCMGKAVSGAASLAKRHDVKVIALAGCIAPDAKRCNEMGIDAYFSILPEILTLEEAMEPERTKRELAAVSEQLFRILRA